MNNYFNTNNLKGADLKSAVKAAKGDNDLVLIAFNYARNIDSKSVLTPWECSDLVYTISGQKPLITSVRRSITTLTKANYLEKTTKQRPGRYGAINYTWKLK